MHKSPVWRTPWQDLSALLRVSHTVHWLLWILTFCYGGDLIKTNKQKSNEMSKPSCIKTWNLQISCVRLCTCTAWTCGDWITDGWAAWMTPWTWTVWPLGSCTSVTVGPVAEAWPAVMDTWNSQNGLALSEMGTGISLWSVLLFQRSVSCEGFL